MTGRAKGIVYSESAGEIRLGGGFEADLRGSRRSGGADRPLRRVARVREPRAPRPRRRARRVLGRPHPGRRLLALVHRGRGRERPRVRPLRGTGPRRPDRCRPGSSGREASHLRRQDRRVLPPRPPFVGGGRRLGRFRSAVRCRVVDHRPGRESALLRRAGRRRRGLGRVGRRDGRDRHRRSGGTTAVAGDSAAFTAATGILQAYGREGGPAVADSAGIRIEAPLLAAGPAAGDLAGFGRSALRLQARRRRPGGRIFLGRRGGLRHSRQSRSQGRHGGRRVLRQRSGLAGRGIPPRRRARDLRRRRGDAGRRRRLCRPRSSRRGRRRRSARSRSAVRRWSSPPRAAP